MSESKPDQCFFLSVRSTVLKLQSGWTAGRTGENTMSENNQHRKGSDILAFIENRLHSQFTDEETTGHRENAKKVRGSLSVYMNWPIFVTLGLILLCVAVTLADWVAGAVASIGSIIIVIILIVLSVYYHRRVNADMVSFGAGYAQIQKQLLQDMEVPYAVTDEYGRLIWMNNAFRQIVHLEKKSHKNITALFEGVAQQFPRDRRTAILHSQYEGRRYQITIKNVPVKDIIETVVDAGDQPEGTPLMFAVYLSDETEVVEKTVRLENERFVAALIYIDNYDEVMNSIEEVRRTLLTALVDRQIQQYFSTYQGVIKRLENDKYFAIFTYEHLVQMKNNGFRITEDTKKLNIGNSVDVTVSIGLGVNGGSYAQNYEYARIAIDMALGRGGDQVVLKDGDTVNYYGGRTESQERNTQVKARVKADALRELIESSDNVLIMGHRISDADCIGAAVGLYRAVTSSQKQANIVLTEEANNIKPLLERLRTKGDYRQDLFIPGEEALALVTPGTLLIVVDNNRAGITECPALVEKCRRIVVLDHHRQAADHIENALLSYVEPGASSASEMVAEILQYYGGGIRIKATDAEAMYAGIVVDTNNFLNKIGVRTFEAASFLRKSGADASLVRKLFRDEIEDYKIRAEAISNAEIFLGCYAISVCPGHEANATVIAAQTANELLGIRDVKASFVLTDCDGSIHISARSIDEMNVQVLMEGLGGGGHLSAAGAQLEGMTVEEAKEKLKEMLMKQETAVYSE